MRAEQQQKQQQLKNCNSQFPIPFVFMPRKSNKLLHSFRLIHQKPAAILTFYMLFYTLPLVELYTAMIVYSACA